MIISKTVDIKISTSNQKHFEKLGYTVKLNEIIKVNVEHLKTNSKIIILAECDVCHHKRQIRYDVYTRKPLFACSYKCAGKLYFAKTQQTFITELNKKYENNDLDFSECVYVNNQTPVKVICKKHGNFKMNPADLIRGRGCTKCNKEKRVQAQYNKFIEKAKILHDNKYIYPDYINSGYINSSTKVAILCPIHGSFKQTSHHHLLPCDCPKCGNIRKRLKRIEIISRDKFEGNQVFPSYNRKACVLFDKISEKKHIHIQHALNGGEYYILELGYW